MRVVETFGPTIQGEGPHAGGATHFLRLGGCDYRCSWCDTMYAVEPELVRAADDLTDDEVLERLAELEPAPMLVISGGNPALWRLEALIGRLRDSYAVIAVETQGSVWRRWLGQVDSLVVSPKPPSSGMDTRRHRWQLERFMVHAHQHPGLAFKVVVFDEDDLAFAQRLHERWFYVPFYLSAGTDVDAEPSELLELVSVRYRWLCEQVASTPALHGARVLPQLHVIAWGQRVGV